MEHTRVIPGAESEPTAVERLLNVDADIVYADRKPSAVWFRYHDENMIIVEHTLPVRPDFDDNCVYGGLMMWKGRYIQTGASETLVAVQIQNNGDWYEL